MNYNRMTIRQNGNEFEVFKMKREQLGGYSTDMAAKRFVWFVSKVSKAQFKGLYNECLAYISDSGAEFMTEHGIPC